jgi:hypothetical protein
MMFQFMPVSGRDGMEEIALLPCWIISPKEGFQVVCFTRKGGEAVGMPCHAFFRGEDLHEVRICVEKKVE